MKLMGLLRIGGNFRSISGASTKSRSSSSTSVLVIVTFVKCDTFGKLVLISAVDVVVFCWMSGGDSIQNGLKLKKMKELFFYIIINTLGGKRSILRLSGRTIIRRL